MKKITRRLTLAVSMFLAALALAPAAAQTPAKPAAAAPAKPAHSVTQRTFASPEEAVKAFVDALRAADMKAIVAIIGPGSESWIRAGDAVQDEQDRQRFLAAYDQKNALEPKEPASFILAIGDDAWPFAVPIVKKGERWAFDARAGREEVANRRVGRNELDTIQTLLALVEAQRVYRTTDPDRNGIGDYARRLISSEGKKDGLYWPASPAEPASPLEALAALAMAQGYANKAAAAPQPFHGYLYRILTAQGADAPGGASSYLVKDKLVGGFAIVAYPVKYGVSGVMTFLVNHEGVVHERDLGSATQSIAGRMTSYNPDKSWKLERP